MVILLLCPTTIFVLANIKPLQMRHTLVTCPVIRNINYDLQLLVFYIERVGVGGASTVTWDTKK